MKKYIMLALVAVFTVGTPMNAQNQRSKTIQAETIIIKATPKERATRLAKQLKLSNALSYRLENYFAKMDFNRDIMRDDVKRDGQNSDDRKAKLEELRVEEDTELSSIIGAEKMEEYIKLRIKRESRMKDIGRGKNN